MITAKVSEGTQPNTLCLGLRKGRCEWPFAYLCWRTARNRGSTPCSNCQQVLEVLTAHQVQEDSSQS